MGKSAFDFGDLIVSTDLQLLVDDLRLAGWDNQAILAQLAFGSPDSLPDMADISASAHAGRPAYAVQ